MIIKRAIQLILVTIVPFSLITCSSTGPQTTTGSPAANPEDPSKDEDVLQLLGIPSEEQTASDLDAVLQEKQDLEQKVMTLESELGDKDGEITQLRKELNEKSLKMSELENLLADLQSEPVASNYETGYQAAYAEYKAKKYEAAISKFEQLLQQDSNNDLSDNCQYWIGESYYGMGMYQRALLEFEKVFGFVDSNKEDASQLKIALCYEKMKQTDNAKDALQRLLVKYPNSEYINLAQKILARL